MPKVYVVSEPMRRNSETGDFERAHDVSPARAHGELVFLLPPGNPPLDPEATLPRLRERLADFRPEDSLLAIGHPLLISWAAAIAARAAGGRLRVLVWRSRRAIAERGPGYDAVSAEVFRAAASASP